MLSQNSCVVVVCVNVLGWGQVDVMSTQNSCVVVCVNVLGWGQVEASRMQICPVFRARVSGHLLRLNPGQTAQEGPPKNFLGYNFTVQREGI